MSEIRWRKDPAWLELTPRQREAAVCAVFEGMVENTEIGGTFRGLIYDRLGLQPDSYCACLDAGGLNLNNIVFEAQLNAPTQSTPAEDAANGKAIILAALAIVDAYKQSPDGPLGKGFTNSHFMMLESALNAAGVEPVYAVEAALRKAREQSE